MKAVFTFLLICLSGIINLYAQSIDDSTVYNRGIRMLETSKTLDNYMDAANYFEQLATQHPEQWLALYYEGFSYIHASYKAKGNNAKDGLIDKAQPLIDRANKLKPGEPEIYVLQAFLYQSRMQVNPEMRGMSYSQKANTSLKKAVEADSSNPRAFLLMAYNTYYTPAMFGGGARNALPIFVKAKEKYLAFAPKLPFMPRWGETEDQQMITECKKAVE
jgi:tetratricopeptide (TPR) repeat protein